MQPVRRHGLIVVPLQFTVSSLPGAAERMDAMSHLSANDSHAANNSMEEASHRATRRPLQPANKPSFKSPSPAKLASRGGYLGTALSQNSQNSSGLTSARSSQPFSQSAFFPESLDQWFCSDETSQQSKSSSSGGSPAKKLPSSPLSIRSPTTHPTSARKTCLDMSLFSRTESSLARPQDMSNVQDDAADAQIARAAEIFHAHNLTKQMAREGLDSTPAELFKVTRIDDQAQTPDMAGVKRKIDWDLTSTPSSSEPGKAGPRSVLRQTTQRHASNQVQAMQVGCPPASSYTELKIRIICLIPSFWSNKIQLHRGF
jgi:hypothetical protein